MCVCVYVVTGFPSSVGACVCSSMASIGCWCVCVWSHGFHWVSVYVCAVTWLPSGVSVCVCVCGRRVSIRCGAYVCGHMASIGCWCVCVRSYSFHWVLVCVCVATRFPLGVGACVCSHMVFRPGDASGFLGFLPFHLFCVCLVLLPTVKEK